MIRFFYFSCLVFLFSFKIEAQQDLQWYVKNGYGKEATTNDYSIYLTGLNFQIDSVQHPALYANGGIPKNDIFIIYDENNHFNSHGGIDVFRNIGSNCFGYNLQLSFLPKYVYFSNLYETDDPPKRVRFGNGNTIRNPNTLSSFDDPSILGVTNTMSCLSLNQDFVVGKDVTLILNYNSIKDLMKRCTINSSVDLIYDNTIFSTSSVFGNSSPQFAYSMNGITDTPGKIIISLNNTPTYNYFNFRVLDTNKSSGSFTLKSDQCKEVSYPTISESISSTFHDPNYIAVQCVYKDADENAWVKYRIQAYNDGARASRAYINFKTVLPNTVDARTFKICKWNHAGET